MQETNMEDDAFSKQLFQNSKNCKKLTLCSSVIDLWSREFMLHPHYTVSCGPSRAGGCCMQESLQYNSSGVASKWWIR